MSTDEHRSLHDLLHEILLTLHRIEHGLGGQAGGGTSSVEVKTSTRGVDITTKAYAGSPIGPAGDAAMDEFMRVGKEIERRLMGQPALP